MLSVLTCLHEGTMSDDYVKVFEEGNQACIKLAYSAIKMVLYYIVGVRGACAVLVLCAYWLVLLCAVLFLCAYWLVILCACIGHGSWMCYLAWVMGAYMGHGC